MMEKCKCGGEFHFNDYCGTHVCTKCRQHKDFITRCYCGWSADGGDGRRQLEEMGETIDPEPAVEYPVSGITRRYT